MCQNFLIRLNTDLSDFSFRNNDGQAQYSMDDGTTWQDFKNPVGTKSITANGTYDVTDYASADVDVDSSIELVKSSVTASDGTYSSSYSVTETAKYLIIAVATQDYQNGGGSASTSVSISGTYTKLFSAAPSQSWGGRVVRKYSYGAYEISAGATITISTYDAPYGYHIHQVYKITP